MQAVYDIQPVRTKQELNEFIQLPQKIYKDNPYWVPPLLSEIRATLDTAQNPFWKHARRELYLARREGKPAGRIAAIIDDNHNQFHQEKTGFFGFFECIEDYAVAEKLWDAARKWVENQGMERLRGPVNPSLNDECAFLLEGFDQMPTVMMPYTHKYYLEFAERYGFHKAKDLYALLKLAADGIPERIERMITAIKRRTGVQIRPFNMKRFEQDIQFLKDIYNSSWEKNWGFVPMTDREIQVTAHKLKQLADPDLVLFAEVNHQPVGVTVTIPDWNQVLKRLNGRLGPIEILKLLYYRKKIKGVRALIGGVKKEFRNSGIIAVLYYETERNAARRGYQWCELGWNLEDNDLINRFDIAIGGKIYKRYRIYELDFASH